MSFPRIIAATLCALVASVVLGGSARSAHADGLPSALEAALHLKIMSFETALAKEKGEIVVGVVHDASSQNSTKAAADMHKALNFLSKTKKVTVKGRPIRPVRIPYGVDFGGALASNSIDVLIVGPGLDSKIAAIAEAARKANVSTHCASRGYLKSGLMIAVVAKAGRPAMVIHAGSVKRSGLGINSQLLRLAEILK